MGEGKLQFFLSGDQEYPTIYGTGDPFGGAWNFDAPSQRYTAFTTPFLGLSQIIGRDGLYRPQQPFGLYRWHVLDPIGFGNDIPVMMQALE